MHELSIRAADWSGAKIHYIYVHELREAGVFTQVIAHLPVGALGRVDAWLEKRLTVLRPGAGPSYGLVLDALKPASAAGWEKRRVARHWFLVRKLWKGLDPRVGHWADGRRVPLIDLLNIASEDRRQIGKLEELRRLNMSASLGPGSRSKAEADRMHLLSAFDDGAWEDIYSGWELSECADRLKEHQQRLEAEELIREEWSGSDNPLIVKNRDEALAELRSTWPEDPHKRRRSWHGWWGS